MVPVAIAVHLTAEPVWFTRDLLSPWEESAEEARRRGHEVTVHHDMVPPGQVWTLPAPRPGADVVVLARPQDLPSPALVAELAEAVAGDRDAGTRVAAPRPLPFEADVAPDSTPEAGTHRVSGALAVRSDTLRSLGGSPGGLGTPTDHDAALAAVVAGAGGGRVVPGASLYRHRRVDADGVVRDALPEEVVPVPDQGGAVPVGHPATMPATAVAALLARVHATEAVVSELAPASPRSFAPFLSVVTRTRADRPLMLADTLTSLAAQTDRDFEVLVCCHQVDLEGLAVVRSVVAGQPAWLRERVRLLEVDRPGRSAPLNVGLDHADGRYVCALDDDDTVLPHWVAAFRAAEAKAPGRVLRAAALRQYHAALGPDGTVGGREWPVALGPAELAWPLRFDPFSHLYINSTPNMSAAFPRGVFRHLALQFDESLATTEDWDYLVRAAAVVGVSDTPEVTSVYRWFTHGSSREEHADDLWAEGHRRVRERFDRMFVLLSPGAAREAAETYEEMERMRRHLAHVNDQLWLVEGAPAEDLGRQDEAWLSETATTLADLVERLEGRLSAIRAELGARTSPAPAEPS